MFKNKVSRSNVPKVEAKGPFVSDARRFCTLVFGPFTSKNALESQESEAH
jgi:hypothetical protein